MAFDSSDAAGHFGLNNARGLPVQTGLAIVSGILGLVAAWRTTDLRWIVGAPLILANWPYTLLGSYRRTYRLKAIATGTRKDRLGSRAEPLHFEAGG
jgi:hypothetical protein